MRKQRFHNVDRVCIKKRLAHILDNNCQMTQF